MSDKLGPSTLPAVTDVKFVAASQHDRLSGLLGFVVFNLGDVRILGSSVRRSLKGRIYIAFPDRLDSAGHRRPVLVPTGRRARATLEAAILAAIAHESEAVG